MQYVRVVYSTGKYVICRSKQYENRVSNIQMIVYNRNYSFLFNLLFVLRRCRRVVVL